MRFKTTITGLIVALIAITSNIKAQSVNIEIETEHQIIRGFGGMNHPYWRPDLTPHIIDELYGNQPGQLGLSILRTYIHENSSEWDGVLSTAKRAKEEHGTTVFASPWTAPPNMKTNNDLVGGELLPEYYEDYADHLLGFVDFMEENSVPLYAISLINEPDIEVGYHSTHWSSQQFIDFLKEQGPKFDDINLIVAESFNFNHLITDTILENSIAEQYVDIIGGHLYGHRWAPAGGLADYPLAREKGKEIWMTEHLTGSDAPEDNTWDLALDLAKEISDCMEANFNAYVWWYIQRFYSFVDEEGNITDKGHVISQYSKFIRPGYIRVGSDKDSAPNVDITAYKSDTSFVIVAVNRNQSNVELSFDIPGVIVDSLTQFTTSAIKKMVNDGTIPVSGGAFDATIDAKSITTFTSNPENGPEPVTSVTGIPSVNNDKVIIYPNPARSGIQVKWNDSFKSLALFNIDGRKIFVKEYGELITDTYLPLNLEKGVYLLMISNEKETISKKIIIE